MATTIRVLSWPKLWLYLPMYVALGKASRSDPSARQFQIEPVPDTTDTAIREVLTTELQKESDGVTALCEPFTAMELSASQHQFRKLPFVMRQPHWLLGRRSDAAGSDPVPDGERPNVAAYECDLVTLRGLFKEAHKIYAYPEKTTSGDFARDIVRPYLMEILEQHLELGAVDETESKKFFEDLPERHFVITFTPWHFAIPHVVAYAEFSGPIRDITALLVPMTKLDKGVVRPDPVSAPIFESVLFALHATLDELIETHGIPDEIDRLLEKWFALANWVLPEEHQFSLATERKQLALFLASYVRRGCYFPYRVVLDAIGPEIAATVQRNVRKLARRGQDEINRDIKRLFGAPLKWSRLKIQERVCVNRLWEHRRKSDDRDLWDAFAHMNPKVGSTFAHGVSVRLKAGGEELPLSRLIDGNGRTRCEAPSLELCQGVGPACVACMLKGQPHALVREARAYLEAAYRQRKDSVDTTFATTPEILPNEPTMLCWDDIAGVVRVFGSELRPVDENAAVSPCLIDFRTKTNGKMLDCLFAIFWSGKMRKGNDSGGARRELRKWAQGRDLYFDEGNVSVAFWDVREPAQIVPIYAPGAASLSTAPESLLGEAVRDAAGYHFAYVAAISLPAEVSQ